MMKYYLLLIFVYILTSCNEAPVKVNSSVTENYQSEKLESGISFIEDFHQEFSGIIDNQHDIVMSLRLKGEQLTGTYYYLTHNREVRVHGSFNQEDNSFKLEEFADGWDKTGSFEGSFENKDNISGNWKSFSKAPGREITYPFTANFTSNNFEWYDPTIPFHPVHVSKVYSLSGEVQEVDVTKTPEMKNITMKNQNDLINQYNSVGYTINEGSGSRTPFFEYTYLGKRQNEYYVQITKSDGGAEVFTGILILELTENKLVLKKSIAGGNRCNNGVIESHYNKGIIFYSQNITSSEFYLMAEEPKDKPYFSLEHGAESCIGEVHYEFNTENYNYTFSHFTGSVEDVKIDPSNASELDYFNHILYNFLQENEKVLHKKQINSFVKELINEITK